MRIKIITYLEHAPFSTLCLMALSFLGFGFFSFNLFFLFQANISVIKDFGWLVLKEGAALQLLNILFNTMMSVTFYTLWKVCERLLVNWLLRKNNN